MKLTEIENLIRKSTLEVLGLPDDKANAKRVRISWPTNGSPAWNINEDVIFLRIYPVDDSYNRLKNIKYQNNNETSLNRTESYTRVIAVDWILYGPKSFDDADLIRNDICKNETLIQNDVYLVYDRPAPIRMPEPFNGQWWERTNLTLYFNEQISREYTIPTIAGAQVIINKEGDTENVDITS